MSTNSPLTDPTLDPVTGIPLDASYITQYQVPLGSQPINLEELNAQGKQSNWLYPDNLPPVVARLQARDLTNPGNAQDLSTDGLRNLNVNINALNPAVPIGGGGGLGPHEYLQRYFGNLVPSGGGTYTFSGAIELDAVIVVGWDIACIGVDTGGTTLNNVSPCMLHLSDSVTLTDYYLGTWFNQYWNGIAYTVGPYNSSRFPEIPLDLRPNSLAGGGLFDLVIQRQEFDLSLNVIIWYYIP